MLCATPALVAADAMIGPAPVSASDAPAPRAQPVGPADATAVQAPTRQLLKGRFCTPYGCRSRSASPASSAVGFAVAAAGAAWLSRRRGDSLPGR